MKILIVDDSKAMRMIVQRTLRQAGFDGLELFEAGDGQEGLAGVEEHRPDLVMSDWNMPNMSGIEFLQALRAKGDTTRFGFVTSEGTADMRELAAASGAEFLIAKPFDGDTFKSVLGASVS